MGNIQKKILYVLIKRISYQWKNKGKKENVNVTQVRNSKRRTEIGQQLLMWQR